MSKNRYSNPPTEIYLLDIRDTDTNLRIDTQRDKEGVFKLIANTAEVKGMQIESIKKYVIGASELIEMEVAFQGNLMLVEKEVKEIEQVMPFDTFKPAFKQKN